MSENYKRIDSVILNTNISVTADDKNEAQIKEIILSVKRKLEELKERNPRTSAMQVAILGCMNLTEQVMEERNKNLDVKEMVAFLDERNLELEKEKNDAQDACKALMKQIDILQEQQKSHDDELKQRDDLLNQYREKMQLAKQEVEYGRKAVVDLQNQLFETQIELSKLKD